MRWLYLLSVAVLAGSIVLVGCQNSPDTSKKPKGDNKAHTEEIKAARAKLSPEDRTLVDAQEYCVVMTTTRLGEMDVPLKIMVKEQPVFLCCKGCQRKALADPDKTIAKVEELKLKAKAESEAK